ncbi:MAG: YaiI/YqxD family protein [Gammaproteobacteria bacterium]|nr:YaiI/YqxD family protein [Gammaproteobacteria bacterium]
MRIWVDADACPNPIKEILFRAAERRGIELTLVANQPLRRPASRYVRTLQVPRGFDAADDRIVALVEAGDLVVTADIPLAAAVVDRGAHALNPRGELYSAENVRERLAIRDMMEELRAGGVRTGGPAALGVADRAAFANQLDRLLAKCAGG